ncbi:4-alpha-glucanotransferase [Chitinophaga sp. Cy-1792]|uniref:4-alpha-glucanotransferase n=1 Tax=Chitinophaga sp. Cy-1792 TaxID=2608339 RepID=UPI001423FF5E|nr:4-alpha-glucanotransferase [Chitinophaga sp. Cy-1792]NIG53716.1 4-alpha-glucanotransferase [Chitinophaga sp. Cy-1792]
MYYRLRFYLHYHTYFGQNIFLLGNIPVLGNNNPQNALQLHWLPNGWWYADVHLHLDEPVTFQYYYLIRELETTTIEGGVRQVTIQAASPYDQLFIDTWNDATALENNWSSAPFTRVFFPHQPAKIPGQLSATHVFKVKAPLLEPHLTVCISGSCDALGNWNTQHPVLMQYAADGWFTAAMDLHDIPVPIYYKYGIYDRESQRFLEFEQEENRTLLNEAQPGMQVTMHDGFVRRKYQHWKGTGLAVPVFSLRSKNGLGTGEFADLPMLADWAIQRNIRLIQLLPVNDTISSNTWKDSYPYAAISSFALHPLYIHLPAVGMLPDTHPLQQEMNDLRDRLNEKQAVDYEAVMGFKMKYLRALYAQQQAQLESGTYWQWFAANEHWLLPYAVFSYLRDVHHTPDYTRWQQLATYDARALNKLIVSDVQAAEGVRFYLFIQYHLHLQLQSAITSIRKKGIALKGDIPIGVSRYSVDTWMHPGLFNTDMQAGAPPDAFTAEGQNWGFPVYNWAAMEADGFEWWRQRLQHMSVYFDAFRIDHILGFFRIWQIPRESVQGLLGFFNPAVPVSREELIFLDIDFEEARFCEPYITEEMLEETFGNFAGVIKDTYLVALRNGRYALQAGFDTQRKIQDQELPKGLKSALNYLLTEILFIRDTRYGKTVYHPRFDLMSTASFQALPGATQQKLSDLYHHYFYIRQEHRWRKEAVRKLPYICKATDMLICGEDLGMVPACVPGVMHQLGILSLEIQHMPKSAGKVFQSPATIPYLSVVTPSTHDMPTLRGWWKNHPALAAQYWREILGEKGPVPAACSADVIRKIVKLHLLSPAMWRIFQLQELLALESYPVPANPAEERINDPAVSAWYWRYRMSINLEDI